MNITEHLNAVAAETNMTIGRRGDAFNALVDAMRDDPLLKADVEMRLSTIDPGVLERDHITRWGKACLERALAEANAVAPEDEGEVKDERFVDGAA
jgi:hypothetical protein